MLNMFKSVVYWETCSQKHNSSYKDESSCFLSNSVWYNAQHVSFYRAIIHCSCLPRMKLSIIFQICPGIKINFCSPNARCKNHSCQEFLSLTYLSSSSAMYLNDKMIDYSKNLFITIAISYYLPHIMNDTFFNSTLLHTHWKFGFQYDIYNLCLTAGTVMLSTSELSEGCLSIRSWRMILPLCIITVFFHLRC